MTKNYEPYVAPRPCIPPLLEQDCATALGKIKNGMTVDDVIKIIYDRLSAYDASHKTSYADMAEDEANFLCQRGEELMEKSQ